MERHDATGILLAGGRSERFGSDKLLAPIGDSTLGRRVLDAMAPCVSRLILSVAIDARADGAASVSRPEGEMEDWFPGLEIVSDAQEDVGPLAGLAAGLEATRTRAAFVAACDYPFLTTEAVAVLLDALEEMDAALPDVNGRLHPLCGAYSAQVLPLVNRFIAERGRRATEFARSLDLRILRPTDMPGIETARVFENVNTPAEMRRAEDRL